MKHVNIVIDKKVRNETLAKETPFITNPVCSRCSLCCFYEEPLTGRLKKCKHLILSKMTGKSICRVWKRRNNLLRNGHAMAIDKYCDPVDTRIKTVICFNRRDSPYDYPKCQFNTGKPMAPWLKEKFGEKEEVDDKK